jgi:hypothetical protein
MLIQHAPVSRCVQGSSTPRGDGNSGGGGSSSSSAAAAAGAPLASVGVSLVEFGKQLISGTKEVIDTVRGVVARSVASAASLDLGSRAKLGA